MSGGKIRMGFLVGKDNDLVEDDLYRKIGDDSFLKDLPDKYRVDTVDPGHPYLIDVPKNKWKDCKAEAHVDVAIPHYINKNFGDEVIADIITPEEISLKRLKSNDINFVIGYDLINTIWEKEGRFELVKNAFSKCGNVWPTWEFQEHIYYKARYMKKCQELEIPMAPTFFGFPKTRTPAKVLKEVKSRGWKNFIIKQSMSAFSLGVEKYSVDKLESDPEAMAEYRKYFRDHKDCPEFIIQECLSGFGKFWETRAFWFNGKFLYAIVNQSVIALEGKEEVVKYDVPKEYLKAAQEIGARAVASLPPMKNKDGKVISPGLVRTDIGCNTGVIHDKNTKWNPQEKTFFLNEIEYGGTNYFTRWLDFDNIPLYADLYVEKAKEYVGSSKAKGVKRKAATQAGPKAKKPAKA